MKFALKYCFAVCVFVMVCDKVAAESLISTDFDNRTVKATGVVTNIASSLNWTTSGFYDPGDMASMVSGEPRTLFDSEVLTQNMFAPNYNYANANWYWTTVVDLKVLTGYRVAVTNVTFDYQAVNGTEGVNTGKKAGFVVTLFSPTAVALGSVTNSDVIGGTTAVISAFASPILLSEAGTYTLEIKAGEIGGTTESGNNCGIDNLSINGTVEETLVASTDFNNRTLTGDKDNIASNLNWTTRGVYDPGEMAAVVNVTDDWAFFDSNALTQNMFAPGWNYGNGGGYWSTVVDLNVLPGFTVTLTDIAFDYWALSGGQELNVARRADFEVTLFDPSAVSLATVTNMDIFGGSNLTPTVPTVTSSFSTPIVLANAGTYTLEIKAGELGGVNETGNHAGIDNLFIFGDVAVIIPGGTMIFIR